MVNKKKYLAELKISKNKVVSFLKKELVIVEALEKEFFADRSLDPDDIVGRHKAIITDCLWKTEQDSI